MNEGGRVQLLGFVAVCLLFLGVFLSVNSFAQSSSGSVSLSVSQVLSIVSPTNGTSYPFNVSDANNVNATNVEFNVSLNTTDKNSSATYSYYINNSASGFYYFNVTFTGNISLPSRVGWNTLTISELTAGNVVRNYTVDYFINMGEVAPILNVTDGDIFYTCEDVTFSQDINVTDTNDNLSKLSLSMNTSNPIYHDATFTSYQTSIFTSRIYSVGNLPASAVGNISLLLTVDDTDFVDTAIVIVSVLDVNSIPAYGDIGVQSMSNATGDNFTVIWDINDTEDGDESAGILTFNISYSNGTAFTLFGINSTGGISYTAIAATNVDMHNITVCAMDTALGAPASNLLAVCGVTGAQNIVCDNFTLNVLIGNRAPNITATSPISQSFSISTGTATTFEINASDFDVNSLQVHWFLDGVSIANDSLAYSATLNYTENNAYTFPCNTAGSHVILVNVTDGEYTDTYNWTVTVSNAASCTATSSSSGGGGGGGGSSTVFCFEAWYCDVWDPCLSADDALGTGALTLVEYNDYIDQCTQLGYSKEACGYQDRLCSDLNQCNNDVVRTALVEEPQQVCEYSDNPSCNDGIKNCHSGTCEVLIDCGGVCGACPTCSDGIQNQNEEGLDCGGPCSYICSASSPATYDVPKIAGHGLTMILLVFLLYLLYKYFFYVVAGAATFIGSSAVVSSSVAGASAGGKVNGSRAKKTSISDDL